MQEENHRSSKTFSGLAPGTAFSIEVSAAGNIDFSCTNQGIFRIHPDIPCHEINKRLDVTLQAMFPQDLEAINKILQSPDVYEKGLDTEFRMNSSKGVLWYWVNAIPDRRSDGTVFWKGIIHNITSSKEYTHTLEQILSDISHIIRKPVTTMLSITSMIEEEEIDESSLKTYAKWIKRVCEELESHTKDLDEAYSLRMKEFVAKHAEPPQDL